MFTLIGLAMIGLPLAALFGFISWLTVLYCFLGGGFAMFAYGFARGRWG